jgi:hypothetical protein
MSDIYFEGCKSYNNKGDGFDIGVVRKNHVFKDCVAWNNGPTQGNGFKVWGDEVWLINSLAFKNALAGVTIKPIWESSDYYFLHNTLVNNNPSGDSIGQIRVVKYNSDYTLKTASLYLYNNILMHNNFACISSDDYDNIVFREEDNNYYFGPGGSSGYVAYDGSWNMHESFTINQIGDGTWYSAKGVGGSDIGRTTSDGISDPGFSDIGADDYSLIQGSLAVNSGVFVGILTDMLGNARDTEPDMGPFEFGGTQQETCLSQGWACCLECSSGHHSGFDSDCDAGFCCDACKEVTLFSNIGYLGDSLNWEPFNATRWGVYEDSGDLRYGIITTDYQNLDGDQLGEYSLIKGLSFNDFIFTAKARSTEDFSSNPSSDYNIVFGFQNPLNYYYMMFSSYAQNSQLFRVVNGVREIISDADWAVPDNDYHDIMIERTGVVIRVYFDQWMLLEASDSTFGSGRVGIGGYNDASLWDDIDARELHAADNNPRDGCIEIDELLALIDIWKSPSGGVAMPELMDAIGLWKSGQGCI